MVNLLQLKELKMQNLLVESNAYHDNALKDEAI